MLHVGNGGAGPAYGLYPLAETAREGHPHLPSPLHPDMPTEGDWNEALGLHEDSEATSDGFLTLLTEGCTYDVLLMVSGPYRGRIVYVDWNAAYAPWFSLFSDFLTWYQTWLRETLAGYAMTGFGHGLPVDEAEAARIAVDGHETALRRRAAINLLIRAPVLDRAHLDWLRRGLLEEVDGAFATLLLSTLARHGERQLEGIAWHWLREGDPAQAVQVVDAMHTLGMADWSEAAQELLERRDVGKRQAEHLLFKLRREGALNARAVETVFASGSAASTALYVNSSLPSPLPVPEAFLTHPEPDVRRSAVMYQSREQLEQGLPVVLKLLETEDSGHVRQGWVLTLGGHDTQAVRESLTGLLRTETNPVVRSAVVLAVERAGWVDAVPALIELTRQDDGVLRLEAARALGALGDLRARPALEALLGQDERPSREHSGYGYSISEAARLALQALKAKPKREGLLATVRAVLRGRSTRE